MCVFFYASSYLLLFFFFCLLVSGSSDGSSRRFLTDFLQEYPTPGTGPYFDTTIPSNITGLVGKSVHLVCKVKNLGNRTVSVCMRCLAVHCPYQITFRRSIYQCVGESSARSMPVHRASSMMVNGGRASAELEPIHPASALFTCTCNINVINNWVNNGEQFCD